VYSNSPGVGAAEARIHAVLAREGSADTGAPAPRRLAEATVAVEDRRFCHHGALDLLAVGRVVWSTSPCDPATRAAT
jgi:membrane carboxypeptidase/penicillin-binding protein PbpC